MMRYTIVRERRTTAGSALDSLERSVRRAEEKGKAHALAGPGVVWERDYHSYLAFQAMIVED